MKLIMGKGDVLVTACGNGELQHILFEQDCGSGEVGAENLQHPDRQCGAEVSQEAIDGCTLALTFENPVSCAVVLNAVMSAMCAFKAKGRTVGEGHDELAHSIHVLWHELTEGYVPEYLKKKEERDV